MAQTVKNLPVMWGTWVQSLGWEDPLEEGMATHSGILAWRIPRDRGVWQTTGPWGHKELDTTERLSIAHCPHSNFHLFYSLSKYSGLLPLSHLIISFH